MIQVFMKGLDLIERTKINSFITKTVGKKSAFV